MGEIFVAFDNNTTTLHELNETAYVILCEIEKGKNKKQILAKIIREFEVDKKEAQKGLQEFLHKYSGFFKK